MIKQAVLQVEVFLQVEQEVPLGGGGIFGRGECVRASPFTRSLKQRHSFKKSTFPFVRLIAKLAKQRN